MISAEAIAKMYKRVPLGQSKTMNIPRAAKKPRTAKRHEARAKTGAQKRRKHESGNARMRVIVRCRPRIPEDLDHCLDEDGSSQCVFTPSTTQVQLQRPLYDRREFTFDGVLGENDSQAKMYKSIGHAAVSDVMAGFNGTVLCYGQTGSGKTYTTFGQSSFWVRLKAHLIASEKQKTPHNRNALLAQITKWPEWNGAGLLPRSYVHIFEHIKAMTKRGVNLAMTFSALQIYQEQLMDLMQEQPAEPHRPPAFGAFDRDSKKKNSHMPSLSIRECNKIGVHVEGLSWTSITSLEHLFRLTALVNERRSTQNTMQNRTSSRSHCVIQVALEQHERVSPNTANKGGQPTQIRRRRSKLMIVDLAGSERVSKSGSSGQRLQEAIKINQSISALGNCVAALAADKGVHVPFRNSKLTRLLTGCLGGNSKTCFCTNVAPIAAHYDETCSTLAFATRALKVRINAVENAVVSLAPASKSGRGGGAPASTEANRAASADHSRMLAQQNSALLGEVKRLQLQLARCASQAVVADLQSPQQPLRHCGTSATQPTAMPMCAGKDCQSIGRDSMATSVTTGGTRESRDMPPSSRLWDQLIERNAELEIENTRLRATVATTAGRPHNGAATAAACWAEQEAQLLKKFGESTRRLQMEIAKQNVNMQKLHAQLHAERLKNGRLQEALSEVSTSMLAVPSFREQLKQHM